MISRSYMLIQNTCMYGVTLGNIGSKDWALELVSVIQIFTKTIYLGSEDTQHLIIDCRTIVRCISVYRYIGKYNTLEKNKWAPKSCLR